jgi:hypothetical protein
MIYPDAEKGGRGKKTNLPGTGGFVAPSASCCHFEDWSRVMLRSDKVVAPADDLSFGCPLCAPALSPGACRCPLSFISFSNAPLRGQPPLRPPGFVRLPFKTSAAAFASATICGLLLGTETDPGRGCRAGPWRGGEVHQIPTAEVPGDPLGYRTNRRKFWGWGILSIRPAGRPRRIRHSVQAYFPSTGSLLAGSPPIIRTAAALRPRRGELLRVEVEFERRASRSNFGWAFRFQCSHP